MENISIAFNVSDELFFSLNTALYNASFFIVYLPTLLTILLSSVTLISIKDFNWKLRVLLLNIFAGESCTWIGTAFVTLGYASRYHHPEEIISCKIATNLFLLSKLEAFAGIAMYGIAIYLYFKHDEKKLKWKVVIPCVVVAWLLGTILVSTTFSPGYIIRTHLGFCDTTRIPSSPLYKLSLGLLLAEMVGCFCIVVICSTLTCRLFRRYLPLEDFEVKRRFARSLIYFAILSAVSILLSIPPSILHAVVDEFASKNLFDFVMKKYVATVTCTIPLALTPLATIIILKPLRSGIATGIKLLLSKVRHCCCGRNKATASASPFSDTTKLQDSIV